MLNELVSKTLEKEEYGDQYRKEKEDIKWSKSSRKHNKNTQSSLDISPVQKEVPSLHKLQDHRYQ